MHFYIISPFNFNSTILTYEVKTVSRTQALPSSPSLCYIVGNPLFSVIDERYQAFVHIDQGASEDSYRHRLRIVCRRPVHLSHARSKKLQGAFPEESSSNFVSQ